MTINETQDEIIGEFSLLEGDMEMTIFYIDGIGAEVTRNAIMLIKLKKMS